MTKFDFMAFGYSEGCADMFVAHAQKHGKEEAVEICKREYDYKFIGFDAYRGKVTPLREPTLDDVQEAHCAFRLGIHEWPHGCYTLVGGGETGAFPVYVIDFDRLKPPAADRAEKN